MPRRLWDPFRAIVVTPPSVIPTHPIIIATPHARGIFNFGSVSCFAVAVLQCLAYIPPLVQFVRKEQLPAGRFAWPCVGDVNVK